MLNLTHFIVFENDQSCCSVATVTGTGASRWSSTEPRSSACSFELILTSSSGQRPKRAHRKSNTSSHFLNVDRLFVHKHTVCRLIPSNQSLGDLGFQEFHQRTLSASSSATAKLRCYAAAVLIPTFGIPPVLIGAVAASTGDHWSMEDDQGQFCLPSNSVFNPFKFQF